MPVSAQTPVNSSTGNGVTTVFPYTFKILAEADILVTVDGVTKTLTTDYSVSGVGNDAGGNVTFVSAPAGGTVVVLRRDMTIERTTDYQENGDLPAATLDDDIDRVVMIEQQINADITRSLKMPAGETGDQTIPSSAAERSLKLLGFDASGNLQVYAAADFPLTAVSAFVQTLLDDADAATARTTLGAASLGANTFTGLQQLDYSSDIASAATVDLGTATGNSVTVTHSSGTTAITSFGGAATAQKGTIVAVIPSISGGTLTVTHHATNMILLGGANITLASGDVLLMMKNHDSNAEWKHVGGCRADGTAWVVNGVTETAWTDYSATSTIVGWSSYTTKNIYYKDIGKTRFVTYVLAGTSNSTSTTFTVPSASSNTVDTVFASRAMDNSVEGATGLGALLPNSSTVNCYRSALAAWTASGTKVVAGQFTYQLP